MTSWKSSGFMVREPVHSGCPDLAFRRRVVDTGLCRELALREQHTREGRHPGVPGVLAVVISEMLSFCPHKSKRGNKTCIKYFLMRRVEGV